MIVEEILLAVQGFTPAAILFTSEDPTGIVFVFKNIDTFCTNHDDINFCGIIFFLLWDIDVEKQLIFQRGLVK